MRDKQQNDSSSSVSRSELIPLPASRSASGARVTTLELPAYLVRHFVNSLFLVRTANPDTSPSSILASRFILTMILITPDDTL